MKAWIGAIFVALVLAGCGAKSSAVDSTATPADNQSAGERLRGQLSSGSFQVDASLESIASAMDFARKLVDAADAGPRKDASGEVIEIIHKCGERLADFAEEPPPLAEVESKFTGFDDQRLKAIETANDCIHDLNEAKGILNSVLDGAPSPFLEIDAALQTQIMVAIDDIAGAIKALGGEVESIE